MKRRLSTIKSTWLFLVLCFAALNLHAQDREITGTVTETDGGPLPGVNVVIKGTTTGVITDLEGNYTIQVSEGETLIFSYVGFLTEEVMVGTRSRINLIMNQDSRNLEAVTVIGYGTQKLKDLTSSISVVNADEIGRTPSSEPMQALQGKVAGMQVVSSGAPGESPTIRVRGLGSYPGIGDSDPLYVVDGMFFDNIDFLNSSDIKSVSVLKDASAAAIYGVEAANGVILVETKSGRKKQKAEISYDGYYGIQIAQNVVQMANSEQFTAMAMESGSDPDVSFILNAMQRYGRSRVNPDVPDVNTDWYKEILRQGEVQNHSLNVSGGSESATYSIGTNYFSEKGILDMKNEYERFNLRAKVDYDATQWLKLGANAIFSNVTKYYPDNSAWSSAYWAVPVMPVYDELNTEAWPYNFSDATQLGYRGPQNPFTSLNFSNDQLKRKQFLTNFYVQLNIIPEKLTFKSTYNTSFSNNLQRNVRLPYYITDNYKREIEDASVTKTTTTWFNQIWNNVLTYDDSFGDHNITVMAGSEYRDDSYELLHAQGLGFPYEYEESWYISQSDQATIPTDQVWDGASRYYGMSYFGRINYNYKNRYLLYGTYRADGSSKYQEKWGYFPSVGIGWVISEEAFYVDNDVLNFLKLRASWGQLGNNSVPASDGASTTQVITLALNDVLTSGTKTENYFSVLDWEVTEETNAGLTARLFNNRLAIDADYYIRDTKDAVISVEVPMVGRSVRRSQGVIRNSGFEMAMNWNHNISNEFSYQVGINFSTLKNEVRDLYGQEYIDGGSAEFRQRSIVGEPLLAYYGWETNGIYQSWEEINNDPIAVNNNLEPGDFKFKDQNNDDVIDGDDRVVLGSYLPTLMYGGNLGLRYKNIEFTASIYGQSGNKILNRKRGEIIWTPDLNMDADLAINRTQIELDESNNVVRVIEAGKYPSSKALRKGWNQKLSDYLVEDGDFFRIQNVQLAYNLQGKKWFGNEMPNARVTLTAERPLTLFDYNGFNPEVADGYDRQTYPVPAVYTIGLSVNF